MWPFFRTCVACGEPAEGMLWCRACAVVVEPVRHSRSCWVYAGPVRDAILKFKYQKKFDIGTRMGQRLGEVLAKHPDTWDLIVPIPSHAERLRVHGYNPAVVLAKQVAKVCALPIKHALHRRRFVGAQTRMNVSERKAAMREAFSLKCPEAICGQRVVLVDDVRTTGATLDAGSALLKQHGAVDVLQLFLAETPKEDGTCRLTDLKKEG